MTHASTIVAFAQRATGLQYILGAEVDLDSDELPDAFDCSELVQWACVRNGVHMPDGHWIQLEYCVSAGLQIDVDEAIATEGALLFIYDGTPNGHVAFSRGDGTTMEARGRAWGCGSWGAARRFNRAARIPNVDYSPLVLPPPPPPPRGEDPNMIHLRVIDDPGFPLQTTPGTRLIFTGDRLAWIASGDALGILLRSKVEVVDCTVAEVKAMLESIPSTGPSPSLQGSAVAW